MTQEFSVTRWSTIDSTESPDRFVGYLNLAAALPDIQRIRLHMRLKLDLRNGEAVLDVGCGTGDEAVELANCVGHGGRVIGIDVSQSMIREAQARSSQTRVPVSFECGDAQELRFPDAEFDACRAERVLIHLPDPVRALREMVRVTRPNGRVVVYDSDWETLIVDSSLPKVARAVMDVLCHVTPHRRIGRTLGRLLQEAGLVQVHIQPESLLIRDLSEANRLFKLEEAALEAAAQGLVSEIEMQEWLCDLQARHTAGAFFAHLTGFCVSGRTSSARKRSAEP